MLSDTGQKGANKPLNVGKGVHAMQLFFNEKEAPVLTNALEVILQQNPQDEEAKKLLDRINVCIEKQSRHKNKANK